VVVQQVFDFNSRLRRGCRFGASQQAQEFWQQGLQGLQHGSHGGGHEQSQGD
jgi:hypothetical protein